MNKQDLVNKYISLHEATTYCQYSQEYLSLRARTGKLKAVKLGRNWMTKKEWLDEYVATVEQYKEYIDECIERKENKINGAEAFKSFTKKIAPPENLPIGELGFFGKIQEVIFNFPSSEFFKNQLGFGFATALVSVLIVAGCVFGNSFLLKVFWQSNSVVKIVSAAGDVIALQFINSSAEELINCKAITSPAAETIFTTELDCQKTFNKNEFPKTHPATINTETRAVANPKPN